MGLERHKAHTRNEKERKKNPRSSKRSEHALSFVYLHVSSPKHHHTTQVEGRLAGDTLELSALKGCGWQYDGNRSVALPPPATEAAAAAAGLRIVVRHPFSATLQVREGQRVEGGRFDSSFES